MATAFFQCLKQMQTEQSENWAGLLGVSMDADELHRSQLTCQIQQEMLGEIINLKGEDILDRLQAASESE